MVIVLGAVMYSGDVPPEPIVTVVTRMPPEASRMFTTAVPAETPVIVSVLPLTAARAMLGSLLPAS